MSPTGVAAPIYAAPPSRGRPSLVAGPRRRRNLTQVGLGLGLAATAALVFATLYSSVGERRPALVIRRPVAAGEVIGASDVGVVRISADPRLRPMTAAQRGDVIGHVASVNLLPGTLVVPGAIDDAPAVAPGEVVVGLDLEPGQAPDGLRAADRVVVLVAIAANGGGDPAVVAEAVVRSVRRDGDHVIVALVLDRLLAPAVAQAAHDGLVSLALIGA